MLHNKNIPAGKILNQDETRVSGPRKLPAIIKGYEYMVFIGCVMMSLIVKYPFLGIIQD